jgi:hypothetical protein
MKYLLMILAMLSVGCSDSAKSGEETGKEIAERLRAPIQETSTITEKIKASREIEVPQQ